METMNKETIMQAFLNNELEQIFCEKCMNTFLTNVYDLGEHVLLEKQSLGLEYYRDAIAKEEIRLHPEMQYIGVIDDLTGERLSDDVVELFTKEEPNYKVIYIMEKLEHLSTEDEQYFTEHVHNMNWSVQEQRHKTWQWIRENYNEVLAEDIRHLCHYYRDNDDFVMWDLHGDNLMRRIATKEIIIVDPYAVNYT